MFAFFNTNKKVVPLGKRWFLWELPYYFKNSQKLKLICYLITYYYFFINFFSFLDATI